MLVAGFRGFEAVASIPNNGDVEGAPGNPVVVVPVVCEIDANVPG